MVLVAVPGVVLVLLNGVWIALLAGLFCLRFRDVQPIIQTAIQIWMLITPIFWIPDPAERNFLLPTSSCGTANPVLSADRSGSGAAAR